jgi:hypothetical protein
MASFEKTKQICLKSMKLWNPRSQDPACYKLCSGICVTTIGHHLVGMILARQSRKLLANILPRCVLFGNTWNPFKSRPNWGTKNSWTLIIPPNVQGVSKQIGSCLSTPLTLAEFVQYKCLGGGVQFLKNCPINFLAISGDSKQFSFFPEKNLKDCQTPHKISEPYDNFTWE